MKPRREHNMETVSKRKEEDKLHPGATTFWQFMGAFSCVEEMVSEKRLPLHFHLLMTIKLFLDNLEFSVL